MACHWLKSNLILTLSKKPFLNPCDKITTISSTENIHCHHHHPEAKRGWKNQIFWLRYNLSVFNLWLYTKAVSVILEEKLHPASPEKQTTNKSPECLTSITFDKHTDNDHYQTYESHSKASIMYGFCSHGLFHHDHKSMTQRHREQHKDKRGECSP